MAQIEQVDLTSFEQLRMRSYNSGSQMTDYEGNYQQLNANQRKAVDMLDGPVLVVAGPGTGKTQLLGMRAAKILQATDSLPSNILCLTFTDSAALEMRQRLIKLIGPEGNRVAVHTFHSFGAEIIANNPEYFYNGARFSPADSLTSYEIMRGIFEELPHSSPLASMMNGEFTYLKDSLKAISHLKRAGLLPEELLDILDHNEDYYAFAEPLVAPVFEERMSKKVFPAINKLLGELEAYKPESETKTTFKAAAGLFTISLQVALNESEVSGKTGQLTAWKTRMTEKNHLGKRVIKDRVRAKKLRDLAKIYQKYATALQARELFDFDDMVTLVAHTMEQKPELRLNLQEQHLYIMVDEFQDTNQAQLRLLSALADNAVNEGRPNILAVGDDDQAVYAFQGAELNNILDFKLRYNSEVIVLTDNYRSTAPILEHSRHVSTQITERLETAIDNIRKELTANNRQADTEIKLHNFSSLEAELSWVTSEIKRLIKQGTKPSEIVVIGRKHHQLVELLPYLHAAGLPVNYERRNDVLESPHIKELITLAEVAVYMAEHRHDIVEELLPKLLSYEFWGLSSKQLWELSLRAFEQRRYWLELMIEDKDEFGRIAHFLQHLARKSHSESVETMLDMLIGSNEAQVPNDDQADNGLNGNGGPREEHFISPYRAYYFNEKRLKASPGEYLELLGNLSTLRREVGNYRPGSNLTLSDFVDYVDLCKQTGTRVVDKSVRHEATESVALTTAHHAKGLEFDSVFVLSCQDDIWGRSARRPNSSLSFPLNLPIEPAGQQYDDSLRLFFVAMTRARHKLMLTNHNFDSTGKPTVLAEFLQDGRIPAIEHTETGTAAQQLSLNWEERYLSLPGVTQKQLLTPTLETYKLSATHLNNFIDVIRGGPQAFLLQNLLRFPQAMTPSQAFGRAVHAVLARAHTHLSATNEPRPTEDILHDFELQMQNHRLPEGELGYWLEKGSEVLQTYLEARHSGFKPSQKAERNFSGQESKLGSARLTGALDLMDIDEKAKTVIITDYKTGKGVSSWSGKTDYEKVKLHKYRQQLLFYKLLVENSRDFAGYKVIKGVLEFVESDPNDQLHRLEMEFDPQEVEAFQKLVAAVWKHIQELKLPDTDRYPANYKGVLAFEADLA